MRSRFHEFVVRQDLQESKYLLLKVSPRYEYQDNKKTDSVIGYKYEVLPWLDKSVGNQVVTVLDSVLPEGVDVGIPSGDIFLKFSGWHCTEYFSDYTGKREISTKAERVERVADSRPPRL